jgi:hypothetical protein
MPIQFWRTKAELIQAVIEDRTQSIIRKSIAHSEHEDLIWSVWEIPNPEGEPRRKIVCHLLGTFRSTESDGWVEWVLDFPGNPDPDCSWGYKLLYEADLPRYYNCPIGFLHLAREEVNAAWRRGVRSYYASCGE